MADARLPFMKLLYHLEADMAPGGRVGAPFGAGQHRVILNVVGGTVVWSESVYKVRNWQRKLTSSMINS